MAFSRGPWRSIQHWILEASNILAGMKKALHLCKALIYLVFLAPRPGLEPGTYGLTEQHTVSFGVRKPMISNAFLGDRGGWAGDRTYLEPQWSEVAGRRAEVEANQRLAGRATEP